MDSILEARPTVVCSLELAFPQFLCFQATETFGLGISCQQSEIKGQTCARSNGPFELVHQ